MGSPQPQNPLRRLGVLYGFVRPGAAPPVVHRRAARYLTISWCYLGAVTFVYLSVGEFDPAIVVVAAVVSGPMFIALFVAHRSIRRSRRGVLRAAAYVTLLWSLLLVPVFLFGLVLLPSAVLALLASRSVRRDLHG